MQGLFNGVPRPVAPSPFITSQATPTSVTNNLRNESRGVKQAKKLLSRHPDMSFGVPPDDTEEIGPPALPTPVPTPPPTITQPPNRFNPANVPPNQLVQTTIPPLHPTHQPIDPSHPPQLTLPQLHRYARDLDRNYARMICGNGLSNRSLASVWGPRYDMYLVKLFQILQNP